MVLFNMVLAMIRGGGNNKVKLSPNNINTTTVSREQVEEQDRLEKLLRAKQLAAEALQATSTIDNSSDNQVVTDSRTEELRRKHELDREQDRIASEIQTKAIAMSEPIISAIRSQPYIVDPETDSEHRDHKTHADLKEERKNLATLAADGVIKSGAAIAAAKKRKRQQQIIIFGTAGLVAVGATAYFILARQKALPSPVTNTNNNTSTPFEHNPTVSKPQPGIQASAKFSWFRPTNK